MFLAFRTLVCGALAVLLVTLAGARAAHATVPTRFTDDAVASGLDVPVGLAEIPDANSAHPVRLLFIEQDTGRIGLVNGTSVSTVGIVGSLSTSDTERGLLGIAVDPQWPARPYVYVHSTDLRFGRHIVISRFTVTGDLAGATGGQLALDDASRYDLDRDFPDDNDWHNGGTVRFGNDGMLYVSLGDDHTGCPALDITEPLGKILRLDVSRLPAGGGGPAPRALLAAAGNPFASSTDSTAKLVYAYGLRNPFRFSIDRQTGAMYVGDVGEGAWEEIDRVPAGGMNLGWPRFEGPVSYSSCSVGTPAGPSGPIYSYDHGQGVAVIQMFVYRRPATGSSSFPTDYEGDVFFVDYYTGFLRRLKYDGVSQWALAAPVDGQPGSNDWGTGFWNVSDAVQVRDGSVWYVRREDNSGDASSGEIRRLGYQTPTDVPHPETAGVTLAPPRPNPGRDAITIGWTQPGSAPVRVRVLDLRGAVVRELPRSTYDGGTHAIVWDGRDDAGNRAPAGLYFIELRVSGITRSTRIALVE